MPPLHEAALLRPGANVAWLATRRVGDLLQEKQISREEESYARV